MFFNNKKRHTKFLRCVFNTLFHNSQFIFFCMTKKTILYHWNKHYRFLTLLKKLNCSSIILNCRGDPNKSVAFVPGWDNRPNFWAFVYHRKIPNSSGLVWVVYKIPLPRNALFVIMMIIMTVFTYGPTLCDLLPDKMYILN